MTVLAFALGSWLGQLLADRTRMQGKRLVLIISHVCHHANGGFICVGLNYILCFTG